MGAGLYMKGRADVDPARIGLWGGSYGGYLTAMGLSRASDLFAAGVDFHGVHDWNQGIRTFVPDYNVLDDPDFSRRAFASSPMATVDGWKSPVLLIHGDDDRNVSFIESINLIVALRKRGVDVEQLVFPDEVHDFLRHQNWVRGYKAAADFFSRRLKQKAPADPVSGTLMTGGTRAVAMPGSTSARRAVCFVAAGDVGHSAGGHVEHALGFARRESRRRVDDDQGLRGGGRHHRARGIRGRVAERAGGVGHRDAAANVHIVLADAGVRLAFARPAASSPLPRSARGRRGRTATGTRASTSSRCRPAS